ncbi:MAG: DUF4172 domain-containing protein [Muribaculaceae bacterium]|nr:DUF4172 domain-containing protein [Muribaculaceae bacterium]
MRKLQRYSAYIWQRPDWPDFRWNADVLLEPISRLSQLHGLLNGSMSMLDFDEKNRALLSAMTNHPFDDGNGRIGRTLADMLLARLDVDGTIYYSMSAEINRNKKAYYEILERTQKGNLDITGWLLWFFDCLEKAITKASYIIERTLQKAAYWDKFREININERQRKIINRLWDGFEGKLTLMFQSEYFILNLSRRVLK